jgi:hypothetical protein
MLLCFHLRLSAISLSVESYEASAEQVLEVSWVLLLKRKELQAETLMGIAVELRQDLPAPWRELLALVEVLVIALKERVVVSERPESAVPRVALGESNQKQELKEAHFVDETRQTSSWQYRQP